jgi:hypothetical protein
VFAPKIAKPQTKAAESQTSKLAPHRSTLVGHRADHDPIEQALFLQRGIGNQAMLRLASRAKDPTGDEHSRQRGQETKGFARRTPGPSWDFSKIPLFSPHRAEQSLGTRAIAEAIQQATVENGSAKPPMPAALSAAMAHANMRDDASADRSARLLRAEALAFGNQILFRHGHYDPNTERGHALIAHELTHVAHQRQTGRSRPQRFVGGDVLSVQFTRAMAEAMTAEELTQQMDILRSHLQSEPDDTGAAENLSVLESVAYSRQGTSQESPGPAAVPQQGAPPTSAQPGAATGGRLTTGEKVLIGVLIGAAVVGGIALIVLSGGTTAPAVIVGLEAAGDVAAGTELVAGTTVVGEAIAGGEAAAVATATTETAAGATATTATVEAATTAATVTAEDAIGSGLVNAGGRLASVLRAIQAQWTAAAPTSAMGALSAIQAAVRSLGLDIGIAAVNADGSITLTNVGGVLTTILTNGAIIITNAAGQIILRLP